MPDLPRAPRGKKALMLTAETHDALAKAAARETIPHQDDFIVTNRAGKLMFRLRNPPPTNAGGTIPPFLPRLGRNPESGAYFVTVTDGRLCELIRNAGLDANALIRHKCHNRTDGSGKPTEFPIEIGQAIFVKAEELPAGNLKSGADLLLVIAPTGQKSLATIPSLQTGVFYYRLAELKAVGDGVELEMDLGGSHIFHQSGLTADLVLRACPIYEEGESEPLLGAQLWRASFSSGVLASTGESSAARPYAEVVEETTIVSCT